MNVLTITLPSADLFETVDAELAFYGFFYFNDKEEPTVYQFEFILEDETPDWDAVIKNLQHHGVLKIEIQ